MKAKNNSKKGTAAVAAIGLAAVVAAGVCLGAVFTRGNTAAPEDFGQQMQVTPSGNDNGLISLAAVTTQNDDGQTVQQITATVTPSDALNAIVDWSIAWGETQGSWGSGAQGDISDYLTITPTSDGALTADVECLAPFGTQAIITANIRGHEEISDTCTVDYVQKFETATANFTFTHTDPEKNFTWNLSGDAVQTVAFPSVDTFSDLDGYTASHTVTAVYSDVYTISTIPESIKINMGCTGQYRNALAQAGVTDLDSTLFATETTSDSLTLTFQTPIKTILGFDGATVSNSQFNAYGSYMVEHPTQYLRFSITTTDDAGDHSKSYLLTFTGVGSNASGLDLPDGGLFF